MSKKIPNLVAWPRLWRRHAPIFAALGDETRLALLARLSTGTPRSISQLAKGSSMTRQGITAHLRALEKAGFVRSEMIGRDCVFELAPEPLAEGRDFLNLIAQQWADALGRLKEFVEKDGK
jgi:DNA-binding transcriptional ArsR family regulator